MLDKQFLSKLSGEVLKALPVGFNYLEQEGKAALEFALQKALAKLDLVTREEFEIQKQILLKTRTKLEALENKLKKQAQ